MHKLSRRNRMGRWILLLLLTSIFDHICRSTGGSNFHASETRCINLKLFDADLVSFQGLLLQKNEQVNFESLMLAIKLTWGNLVTELQTEVWIQALLNDNGTSPSSNQLSSELASLGNHPFVTVMTSAAVYTIPVEWRQVSYFWSCHCDSNQ